jgi:hypothetical protein
MMNIAKALAPGKSEMDSSGERDLRLISLRAAAPPGFLITARLSGSDICEAEGITVRGNAPVLAMCRELIRAGYDPTRVLEAYRGDILCLRVRSIGEGARLTIEDNKQGTPALRRWRGPRRVGSASPIGEVV